MKILPVLTLSIIFITSVNCQTNPKLKNFNNQFIKNEKAGSLTDFYLQHSYFTDPGEYQSLYENLPDSFSELCKLINSQFIHPFAELPRYREQIPKERWNETVKYPTVKSVLEGLLFYDSRGLVEERKLKDRLVLGCRHKAILFASILKFRGVPTRVRGGHASYLRPGAHLSHTICEVWNKEEKRWMLVDPSTGMIDFNRDQFEFSYELWMKLQNGEINPDNYGFAGRYSGFSSIVGKIPHDLAFLLGLEYPVYYYAPMLDYVFQNNDKLTSEHTEILNKICELMKSIDFENLKKLSDIYLKTPEIQISKSFIDVIESNKKFKPVKKEQQ